LHGRARSSTAKPIFSTRSRGGWSGPAEEADAALAPARALSPALDGVAEVPLPALQAAFDPLYPAGLQNYWRAHLFKELSDNAIGSHVGGARHLPTALSGVLLHPIDGAAARVAPDATAWSHRGARWSEVIFGTDPDPASFERLRSWTIEYREAVRLYALGGAYVNFTSEDGQEHVRASYGPSYAQLAELKRKYDPDNVFRVNQNIEPAR
jgi:Berberine and berberine like